MCFAGVILRAVELVDCRSAEHASERFGSKKMSVIAIGDSDSDGNTGNFIFTQIRLDLTHDIIMTLPENSPCSLLI